MSAKCSNSEYFSYRKRLAKVFVANRCKSILYQRANCRDEVLECYENSADVLRVRFQ